MMTVTDKYEWLWPVLRNCSILLAGIEYSHEFSWYYSRFSYSSFDPQPFWIQTRAAVRV